MASSIIVLFYDAYILRANAFLHLYCIGPVLLSILS